MNVILRPGLVKILMLRNQKKIVF